MATLFGSVQGLVHDLSAALVNNQIATKVSGAVTGFVNSGFGVVDDLLKIVRDLTAPPPSKP